MWEPQLQELCKEFRCVALDLWDHGKSDSFDQKELTFSDLADHGFQLMQSLGISEFAVVGLSVGGMWGLELALKYPHCVKALVLMDTYVGSEPLVTQQKYFALLNLLEKEKRFTQGLLSQVVPLFFSPFTASHNPQLIDDFKTALAAMKEESILGIVRLGRTIFSRSCSLNRLFNVNSPTCVIVGKDDLPRPPKESKEMASLIRGSELHIIENAGHVSNLEQPEKINALLKNFIQKSVYEASLSC